MLEARVRGLGLDGRVLMPGFVKDTHTVLSQTDLFVLPSRSEGFPNVLCEAMACGVASIATDCPSGPRHIVRNGLDGLLVPEGNTPSLADAMDSLMSDEAARRLLGGRASTVSERFSISKVMGMWEDLLMEVTNRKGNSAEQKAKPSRLFAQEADRYPVQDGKE
jgi:glycosyltransferase involved in cell wall biosynthesis